MSHLIALGDSHLESLKLAADLGLLLSDSNEFCIVPGATAVAPGTMQNSLLSDNNNPKSAASLRDSR